eukprot:7978624-Pyramimonas_sp.AAC.1
MLNPIAISPYMRPARMQRYKEKTGDGSEIPQVTLVELRLHIIEAVVATGGVVNIGSSPPGALDRAVQASVQEHSMSMD